MLNFVKYRLTLFKVTEMLSLSCLTSTRPTCATVWTDDGQSVSRSIASNFYSRRVPTRRPSQVAPDKRRHVIKLRNSDVPSFQSRTARSHRGATALPCWSILPLPRDPRGRSGRRRPAGSRAISGGSQSPPPPRSTPGTARCRGSRCSGAAGW